MGLNKTDILKKRPVIVEEVNVPEWGGSVHVRQMTARQRDDFEASMLGNGKTKYQNIRARLAGLCICDEDGNTLFDAKDVNALGDLEASALDRLLPVIQRINGMSNDDLEEYKKKE